MPSLLETCEDLFNTRDLYEVLKIEKTATSAQIKKAYHKISLKVHPDRTSQENKDRCTQQFQCVGAVYALLSDDSRRGLYDECGEVDDENDPLQQNKDWEEYWRLLFPKITLKDIQEYENKYKGSEEERADLKKAYIDSEGNMDKILESVILSSPDDEDRFRDILNNMIKSGEVKKFEGFEKVNKSAKKSRKRAADLEAKEAEQARKEMGLDDSEDSLANKILARQAARRPQVDSFLDGLAAKYGAKKSSGKKKK